MCLLVARLSISVAITRGKSPSLEGLCPFLCTEVTALSLYELIKNSNDVGEISFYGGAEGWSIKERVKRQEGTNGGVGGGRKGGMRSKDETGGKQGKNEQIFDVNKSHDASV